MNRVAVWFKVIFNEILHVNMTLKEIKDRLTNKSLAMIGQLHPTYCKFNHKAIIHQ